MELPRGARRCEKADSIGGEWGFLRQSFLRKWERFAEKVGEGSGLALWACYPLIANESPARMRN